MNHEEEMLYDPDVPGEEWLDSERLGVDWWGLALLIVWIPVVMGLVVFDGVLTAVRRWRR